MKKREVIVVGSGPAGYTAAIYLARAELKPLILAGEKSGGQLMLTTEVENYPGFEEGIKGPELMVKLQKQAERFGAEVIKKNVVRADLRAKPFKLYLSGEEKAYEARAILIATGAESRLLGIKGEKALLGRGVSTCAVCDAAFFKGKRTAVVGGGDSAMEGVLALIKQTDEVSLIHRSNKLRASRIMQKRVLDDNRGKVKVYWESEVVEILGKERVTGARLRNRKTGEIVEIELEGIFIEIGHIPATEIFRGQLELDEKGYLPTGLVFGRKSLSLVQNQLSKKELVNYPTMTGVPGVFAAGDVVDFRYRQAITAAGFGCMAAIDIEKWLNI